MEGCNEMPGTNGNGHISEPRVNIDYHEHWREFTDQTFSRLDKGAVEYGESSFKDTPLSQLTREIEEETLDVAGWGYALWCRVRRLRAMVEEMERRLG